MSQNASRLVVVDEWTGKYRINDSYRPIAEGLVKKYRELNHIGVDNILFLDDTEGKGRNKDKVKNAQVGKIPERWSDLIWQMTGRRFDYFIEFFRLNIYSMSREQIVALVYHELRHIGPEGDLVLHDIEDWANMHYKLGPSWATTQSRIPDLLDEDVDWDSITGRRFFDEPERQLSIVKAGGER